MRRFLAPAVAVGVAALTITMGAGPSQADDSTTLTVVGTSDVFDSNLVTDVIKKDFEAANPGVTLNYISKGTGAAIQYAEAGTASALVVHAASLENNFVGDHFSLEKYGRAIFWGDYVLLGPASDPAHVGTDAPHDIVKAYEDVAAAGAQGKANFVSRGGNPGTTVQEHAIWNLTSGVQTCDVDQVTLGGGKSPSTATGACPATIPYPDWYHATGLTQAPNILNGDVCNYTGATTNNCYVFTDRGTYQYLVSTHAINNLKILVRDNDTTATGGNTLLVNSFHAYAINPAAVPAAAQSQVNTVLATKFLNFITSSSEQAKIGQYLSKTDPPFIPDATPTLSASALPSQIDDGDGFTVKGSLKNVVPGTPALNGVSVNLMRVANTAPGTSPKLMKSVKTDSKGNYSIGFHPHTNGQYSLQVAPITKVENSTLSPVFGDLLNGVTRSLSNVHVMGKVTITSSTSKSGKLTLKGKISPAASGSDAHLSLYGVHTEDVKKGLHYLAQKSLKDGATSFTATFTLSKRSWTVQLHYVNVHHIDTGLSSKKKISVT